MDRRRRNPLAWLAAAALLFGDAVRAEDGMCTQLDQGLGGPAPEVLLDQRIFLEADRVLLDKDGLSQLEGAVKLRQGGKEFTAEMLDYDDSTGIVTVRTESVFRNPDLVIRSGQASFDLNAESGAFVDTEYVLPTRAARGRSERITVTTAGTARLEDTAYTTCAPDSDAWYIEASDIRLDHDKGLGSARHARLRFAGVPILYMPWFQFPIDERRRSGLLLPTVGDSDRTGFDVRWPVYLNLAPNYDATVTPRLMSERGLQMGASGRYLLRRGEGAAAYEFLDSDDVYGDSRSLFRYDHVGLLSRRLGLEATYAEVSDPHYFEDLGGSFASSSITHLERAARLTYQAPGAYRVQTMVQTFQPIDSDIDDIDTPYKRLPQIRLDALTRNALFDTRAGIDAELVNFVRDEASVEGQRIDLQPYLHFLRDRQAWYFSSQAELRHTAYLLTGTPDTQPDSPERSLPVISAEGGLRFERITRRGAIQTLEPRGFALYVPYENQDELPLFDSGEPDFDFVQLFARNRFSGADRVADARHVAGALTTRLIDPQTGLTRYSASVGQLYRFDDPRVILPGVPPPPSGATEFIGEVVYNFTQSWSATATSQWSPRESEFERTSIGLRYRDLDRGERLDLSYRYRRGLLEQTDVAVSWPLTGALRIAARSRYSLDDKQSREAFAGLEYQTCCWAIRTSYRRYIASSDGDFNSGIYLQLELKGLTRIGAGFNGLLPLDEGEDEDFSGNSLGVGSGLDAAAY